MHLNYPKSEYRAEIDGLRAVAVLSVILFHAGFKLFSGGFVGVDVFFVISGYLITSMILTEKQEGTFSILHFYERRARRILPPLFFIMFICLPIAWFALLPDQLTDFSKSLVAVPIFVSNLFFWKNTGYFSANTAEIPFIHTWSLGIEEQYYLLFPLFIIAFWKIGHNKLLILIATILLFSLLISENLVQNRPSTAFFFIFPRAWELLIGSVLAFIAFKKIILHEHMSLRSNQLMSSLGLLLVLFSIFLFSKNTPFPGLYALVPVIGTALIIGFSSPKTFVYQCLSHQYIVQIGLISYSAYLWHQPLFSFARICFLGQGPEYMFILFSGITLLLAFLTWKFIEQPFRNRKNFSRRQIFLFSTLWTLFFVCVGVVGTYNSPYAHPLFRN
ncbi:MAG: acyltransferase [Legionellales bacterium]|nr:acyltransferase [Legionellales bacterium]